MKVLRGCGCVICRMRATPWWRRKLYRYLGSERWLAPKPGIAGVSTEGSADGA